MLEVSREEIDACARLEGFSCMEDESNFDTRYSRNYLRHRIIPLLRERFPGCDAVLARAAIHFSESQSLLQELARNDSREVLRDGRIVSSQLAKMDDARARNLMRFVLRCEGITLPDSARLYEIVRQVCHAAPDSHLRSDLGEMKLHRYRGKVWLIPHYVAVTDMEWRGEVELKWGNAVPRFREMVGEGVSRENC
ncbi:MAG: TilS substrate-binding domain-containing protein [Betaproteobacteria bacterium]|nr:TilS substrate-binding domain-containing protein [Betaproteobacteria bacterium]